MLGMLASSSMVGGYAIPAIRYKAILGKTTSNELVGRLLNVNRGEESVKTKHSDHLMHACQTSYMLHMPSHMLHVKYVYMLHIPRMPCHAIRA